MAKKVRQIKGMVVAELNVKESMENMGDEFAVYIKDEWAQPYPFQSPEMTFQSIEAAIDFAKDYFTEVD